MNYNEKDQKLIYRILILFFGLLLIIGVALEPEEIDNNIYLEQYFDRMELKPINIVEFPGCGLISNDLEGGYILGHYNSSHIYYYNTGDKVVKELDRDYVKSYYYADLENELVAWRGENVEYMPEPPNRSNVWREAKVGKYIAISYRDVNDIVLYDTELAWVTWKYDGEYKDRTMPEMTSYKDWLYFESDGKLFLYDTSSKRLEELTTLIDGAVWSLKVDDDYIYTQHHDKYIIYDRESLEHVYTTTNETRTLGRFENSIYIAGKYDELKKINLETLELEWMSENGMSYVESIEKYLDKLIVQNTKGQIAVLNSDSGKVLWSDQFDSHLDIALDRNYLNIFEYDGSIYTFDLEDISLKEN